MSRPVFIAQKCMNGRYLISEMKTFLWFKWWKPLPYIYVELDRLTEEAAMLRDKLKFLDEAIKQENKYILDQIAQAEKSYESYHHSVSPRNRKYHYSLQSASSAPEPVKDESKNQRTTGPPMVIRTTANDQSPRQGQDNKSKQNGNQPPSKPNGS